MRPFGRQIGSELVTADEDVDACDVRADVSVALDQTHLEAKLHVLRAFDGSNQQDPRFHLRQGPQIKVTPEKGVKSRSDSDGKKMLLVHPSIHSHSSDSLPSKINLSVNWNS